MKTTKLILLVFLAVTAVFACNDEDTVYPERKREPVKAISLDNLYGDDLIAMPDGTAAVLVKVSEKNSNDSTNKFVVAKISRNGNVTFSDTIQLWNEKDSTYPECFVTPSGEIFIQDILEREDNKNRTIYNSIVVKIDNNGRKVYDKWDADTIQCPYTPLDNGELARFSIKYVEMYDSRCLVMETFDNKGDMKKFTYVLNMELDKNQLFIGYARSFEDKIILCNYFQYYIFNTDGTSIGSGSFFDNDEVIIIYDLKYINGNLYAVLFDYYNRIWKVAKMDTLGNRIFITDPLCAIALLKNFIVYDDTIVLPGYNSTDSTEAAESYGIINIINNNNHNFIDTVSFNYNGIDIAPYIISPDRHGEYDVYAILRHEYDDWNDFKKGKTSMDGGSIFIYHTDDLHKLQMK